MVGCKFGLEFPANRESKERRKTFCRFGTAQAVSLRDAQDAFERT
jgi:hypothetical protein